jgi:hypothetical protein
MCMRSEKGIGVGHYFVHATDTTQFYCIIVFAKWYYTFTFVCFQSVWIETWMKERRSQIFILWFACLFLLLWMALNKPKEWMILWVSYEYVQLETLKIQIANRFLYSYLSNTRFFVHFVHLLFLLRYMYTFDFQWCATTKSILIHVCLSAALY